MKNKKRSFGVKKILLAGAAVVCVGTLVFIYLLPSKKAIPHHNLVDTKIYQYSDKNITRNAIATNPEFKNIAFETPPTKSSLFSSQIAAVIRAVKSLAPSPIKEQTKEYGSWVWTPVMDMSPEYMQSIISGAKARGANTIYVSIDSYLDVFVMPKGNEREKQKELFSNKLDDFIRMAKEKDVAVDAEAGWRNWAEGENIYKAFAIVSYVKNFNATRGNKFRGFQYDVEPYLLDSYKKDAALVLKNFVALIDKTDYFLGTSTLRFSVVVPDFYDEKDALTPSFDYNGKKDFAFGHLLNILDRRPDSSIIIMSYRNLALGDDGSIEISKNEMQTAKDGAYNTKIIIAQETGDVPPPYITFHNTSKKYLARQIGNINTAFDSYPNFGGIAVHYINAFLALK